MALGTIDWVVIVAYFLVTLGFGLWVSRNENNEGGDFFVAGRSLGWFVVGASLFASNISSEHLIGLAADGFRTGLAVGNYEWGASVILVVLATVFVPFFIGAQIQTMPEFLQRRFGEGAKVYLSLITIAANVLVRISVALYAGGLVIESMLGINMWVAIFILSLATVIYTAAGGLKAVVYTDALQAVILLAGTTTLTFIALDKVGGWSGLQQALPEQMFDMVRPADDPEMPWTGLLLGVPVLGIWYWCTDQVIVQRVLGAKNIHHGRMGAIFAAFLKILPVFLFVLPGLCGRALYPDVDSQAIFPILVDRLLPVGLKGLVGAALLAALMSSIDSTLNSTGTLVSLDFFRKWKPQATPQQVLWVGRVTTVVVMIFGILWVQVVMREESLFQYLQQVNAAISPPIAAAFLFGVFWNRANHTGVMAALIGGLAAGLGLMMLNPFPFLVSAGVTFIISIALLVAGSLLSKPPEKHQLEGLTWSGVNALLEREVTSHQRRKFKILVAVVLTIMTGLWITFA